MSHSNASKLAFQVPPPLVYSRSTGLRSDYHDAAHVLPSLSYDGDLALCANYILLRARHRARAGLIRDVFPSAASRAVSVFFTRRA